MTTAEEYQLAIDRAGYRLMMQRLVWVLTALICKKKREG